MAKRGRPAKSEQQKNAEKMEKEKTVKAAWGMRAGAFLKMMNTALETENMTRKHDGSFGISTLIDAEGQRVLIVEDDENIIIFTGGKVCDREPIAFLEALKENGVKLK